MTTPLDFSHRGTLGQWASHPRFDLEAFRKAYDHAPWYLLQAAFNSLKPFSLKSKMNKIFAKFEDKDFLNQFFALELWGLDNVSFLGLCFQEIIQNQLIQGQLIVRGQRVDLQTITAEILDFTVEDDHIVHPNSTLQNKHLRASQKFKKTVVRGGHIGGLIGSRAQAEIWPLIAGFPQSHGSIHT